MKRKNRSWELPAAIEGRLGEGSYGRQRAIFEDGNLLIVLHDVPGEADLERDEIAILRTADGQYLSEGYDGAEQQLRKLISAYRAKWEECDQMYDQATQAADLFRLLEILAPMNRASTNLAAALQSAREFVKEDKFLIGARDEGYEVSRAFDLLATDAKLKLDYVMAKNAEAASAKTDEMAEAQHKLNILAAITFPLMALATLLGVNLTHGLEDRSPVLFYIVLIAGFAVGFGVKSWVTRR
jgi:Mg2+ and Co2+ transporter CorA